MGVVRLDLPSVKQLIKCADMAMYDSKRGGGIVMLFMRPSLRPLTENACTPSGIGLVLRGSKTSTKVI
jgi:hypothetical protein